MSSIALPTVGFMGLGDQGLPMATAIAEAHHPLHVRARRPGSLDVLSDTAHVRHDDTKDLAAACGIVALCVSADGDVLRLVGDTLLDALSPGSVAVNHGTGTPATPSGSPRGAHDPASTCWAPPSAGDDSRPGHGS